MVRSLYFDTAEVKAVRDKINGVAVREKYRIRIYNHYHSSNQEKSERVSNQEELYYDDLLSSR